MSLTLKFALFTSVLCIVIIAATSFLSYQMAHRDLVAGLGQRLEAVAATAALSIDGDSHERIRPQKDNPSEAHESEDFIVIRDQLRRVKQINNLQQELYTFRRGDGRLDFVVMSHERPFVDTYQIKEAMLPTLNKGLPAHTGIYSDAHGSWMSGYGPIKDARGQVVGLLEVDLQVDEILALSRQKFTPLVIKSLIFAVLAVIGSFLLAKGVTAKINHLTEVTEKISLGKMDQAIVISGKDEVARLAASLERMRESLKIAAELIN